MQDRPEEVRENKETAADKLSVFAFAIDVGEAVVVVRQAVEPIFGDILPEL